MAQRAPSDPSPPPDPEGAPEVLGPAPAAASCLVGLDEPALPSLRVDRWLWCARLFKSRAVAAAACKAGHVKRAGQAVTASKLVRRADRLEILTPAGPRVLVVVGLATHRGPAPNARSLYEDHSLPTPRDEPDGCRTRGLGRPSKRDLRRLLDFVGKPRAV